MPLTKEAILYKTHYGINIYSLILGQYYPGTTVLSLSGRDCKPTYNPFNDNKQTLKVSIVNNCAQHTDLENPDFKGDVFDLAALHFNLAGEDLLVKLNEVLHLNIGSKPYHYTETPQNFGDISTSKVQPVKKLFANPEFSFYKSPASNTVPFGSATLLEIYKLIKSNAYASQTATLRTITDAKQARKYKAFHFDYVTFSGVFTTRKDEALQKHSGLFTVDLDHINNVQEWKERLLKDEYFETQLLFVSPSGDGLKWVVPIDITRAIHKDYFKSISIYLKLTYGLELDRNCSDVSRACFLPHDPNIYMNPKYLQ